MPRLWCGSWDARAKLTARLELVLVLCNCYVRYFDVNGARPSSRGSIRRQPCPHPRSHLTVTSPLQPEKMAQVRPRSSSPTADEAHHKKPKTSHTPTVTDADADVVAHFATNLFDASSVEQLRTGYADSMPFKHVVVDTLFRDDLLRSVKDECIEHLSFTEKETDIYKVWRRAPRPDDPSLTTLSPGEPNGRSRLPLLPLRRPALSLPEPPRPP